MNLLTPPAAPRDPILTVSQHSSVRKEINIQSVDIDRLYILKILFKALSYSELYFTCMGTNLNSI